jgi:hypothetical protein
VDIRVIREERTKKSKESKWKGSKGEIWKETLSESDCRDLNAQN